MCYSSLAGKRGCARPSRVKAERRNEAATIIMGTRCAPAQQTERSGSGERGEEGYGVIGPEERALQYHVRFLIPGSCAVEGRGRGIATVNDSEGRKDCPAASWASRRSVHLVKRLGSTGWVGNLGRELKLGLGLYSGDGNSTDLIARVGWQRQGGPADRRAPAPATPRLDSTRSAPSLSPRPLIRRYPP